MCRTGPPTTARPRLTRNLPLPIVLGALVLATCGCQVLTYTGPTGETYSADGAGAIALDTEQADELVQAIQSLRQHPERSQAIRRAGPCVAARYTWENVFEILLEKVSLSGSYQKIIPFPATSLCLPKAVHPEVRLPVLRQHLNHQLTAVPV